MSHLFLGRSGNQLCAGAGPLSKLSLARNIGSVPVAAQLTFWGVAEEVGGNNRETWLFALFLRILAQHSVSDYIKRREQTVYKRIERFCCSKVPLESRLPHHSFPFAYAVVSFIILHNYVVKDNQFIEYLRMVRIERIDELEAAGVQVTCTCSARQQTFSSPLSLLQCFFMT